MLSRPSSYDERSEHPVRAQQTYQKKGEEDDERPGVTHHDLTLNQENARDQNCEQRGAIPGRKIRSRDATWVGLSTTWWKNRDDYLDGVKVGFG